MEEKYLSIEKREEMISGTRRVRRQYLRFKEAEIIYSLQHKKLLQLADEAGAIYRFDNHVLINKEIFDAYFERFHEEPMTAFKKQPKNLVKKSKKAGKNECQD